MLFMRGLQDVWSVSGGPVLEAFDLSAFRLICDVGGERGVERGAWEPRAMPARQRRETVGTPFRVRAKASRPPVGRPAPPRARPALCASDPGHLGAAENPCAPGCPTRPCTRHARAHPALAPCDEGAAETRSGSRGPERFLGPRGPDVDADAKDARVLSGSPPSRGAGRILKHSGVVCVLHVLRAGRGAQGRDGCGLRG